MNSLWAGCPQILVMYMHGMYMHILVYTKICMYIHAYPGMYQDMHVHTCMSWYIHGNIRVCTVLPSHVQVVRIPDARSRLSPWVRRTTRIWIRKWTLPGPFDMSQIKTSDRDDEPDSERVYFVRARLEPEEKADQ